MNEYFLKLNETKTRILVMAPPSVQKNIIICGTFIGGICVRFIDSAKNLGVILDNELSFEQQISKGVIFDAFKLVILNRQFPMIYFSQAII